MDDRTGSIYRFQNDNQLESLAEQLRQFNHSLTEIEGGPNPNCPICGGKGSIKSKPYTKDGHVCFYRPCQCTRSQNAER